MNSPDRTSVVTSPAPAPEENVRRLATAVSSAVNLDALNNSIDAMIWERTATGDRGYTYVSQQCKKIYGYTPEQIMANPRLIRSRILAEDAARLDERLNDVMDDGATFQMEYRVLRENGKLIYVRNLVTPIRENGKTVKLRGVVIDVTDYKVAVDEQKETERKLEDILQSINAVVWDYDFSGRKYGYVSAGIERLIGVTPQLVQDNPALLHNRILGDGNERLQAAYGSAIDGKPAVVEYQLNATDERVVDIRHSITPLWVGKPQFRLTGTLFDISGEKGAEREKESTALRLKQAQKLEAIGQLAAGIAHEINTPSQFIGDNLQFIQDAFNSIEGLLVRQDALLQAIGEHADFAALAADLTRHTSEIDLDYLRSEVPNAVAQAIDGVARIASIVKAMKEFSHPGSVNKEFVDLNKAIANTLTVARNEWKYVADVVTDYDNNLPLVECLPGEINQTFLNMIINAAHAISERSATAGDIGKGRITISTRSHGDHVRISIADNGAGISKQNMEKVFEPFFTTKPMGRGTGQGLALAHSTIYERHQGHIEIESEVGVGTRFTIALPIKGTPLRSNPRAAITSAT